MLIACIMASLNTRTPINGCGINEEDDADTTDTPRHFSALAFHHAQNTSTTRVCISRSIPSREGLLIWWHNIGRSGYDTDV